MEKFYGIYRGIVTQRSDSEGRWRIKGMVPQVSGAYETDWMWGCLPITYFEEAKKHDDHTSHTHALVSGHATVDGITEAATLSSHSLHVHEPRATTTTPAKGQGIWVMFEGGDANKPVWVGVQ